MEILITLHCPLRSRSTPAVEGPPHPLPHPPPNSWTVPGFWLTPLPHSCFSYAFHEHTFEGLRFSCRGWLKNRSHIPVPVLSGRNNHPMFSWAYSWTWRLLRGWYCFPTGFFSTRPPFRGLPWLIYHWLFSFCGRWGVEEVGVVVLCLFWQKCRSREYITHLTKVIIRKGTCLQIQSNRNHYYNKIFDSGSHEAMLLATAGSPWIDYARPSPNPAPCFQNYTE